MDYGRAIRIVRNARGLSQADLAKRLTVGASHLSLIEAGKRQPSVGLLREVATSLNIPPHLMTLLASSASDLERPENSKDVAELAQSLLRLLLSNEQPTLPLKVGK